MFRRGLKVSASAPARALRKSTVFKDPNDSLGQLQWRNSFGLTDPSLQEGLETVPIADFCLYLSLLP